MSSFSHILLYCLILVLSYFYDYNYRRTTKVRTVSQNPLPVFAFIISVLFIVTEGLRYGRGVDQLGNYGPFYLHCLNPAFSIQDMDTLFVWLNQFVYKIDPTKDVFPFGSIFIVFALIFWICLWQYYKDIRKCTALFLVLAILTTNYITEWTIRQGVSFSFILLSLKFLDRKKWIYFLICALIAIGIHKGNLLSIFIIIACYFFCNKKPFPYLVTIPLFIILEYSLQVSSVNNLISKIFFFANIFDSDGYYDYLNVESVNSEEVLFYQRGFFTQFITVAFYSAILFIGNIGSKYLKNNVYVYNAFVIGIMITEPFRLLGTISRIALACSILWFIPLSMVLHHHKYMKKKSGYTFSLWIIICYLLMYYGRYIFLNPQAKYTWDL